VAAAREYSRLGHRSAADSEAEATIRRMRLALAMVALVIVCGTAGYMLITHMGFLAALFMTVTTITTVGYGEVEPLGPAGRWFSIVLILGGVGLSLYTLASAFEMLVSQQFQEWRQRKKMSTCIDKIIDHYIICGYGRIGRQIADELAEAGEPFVVIDADPDRCARLLERGIPFVEGDATLDDVLHEAGIERARGFVGALNSDADNVMTVVSARGLNPDLFIVARAALPEAEKKLRRAGANEVISPYVVGAHRISLSLLRPGVASFLTALVYNKDIETEITEHSIAEGSPLAGQTLEGAGMAHEREVLPLAIMREGKLIFSPLPDTVLQIGDTLIIVTSLQSLQVERK
jgi:voltage-gated potassium channel